MKYEFKTTQSEEYYRKLLLLDKVKPFLTTHEKQYIFDKGYCWDILFNDKKGPVLCFYYALDIKQGKVPKLEQCISRSPKFSYLYAKHVLKDRFKLGEKIIQESGFYEANYMRYLSTIGKNYEVDF